ncbi:hypothetical protein HY992_01595 [Candidatus Micrarchaeota archaeon]|nr:hypothetical protein [Candidatus Micrarchaeota archaeon]
MDLEGFARRGLKRKRKASAVASDLSELILEVKPHLSKKQAVAFANAVVEEVEKSSVPARDEIVSDVLRIPLAGVSMGEIGVGCRGQGDFFVHREIARIGGLKPALGPSDQDDAGGVVLANKEVILVSVDGTHSRLSEWPFLAGFHVARAALRDVLVKGGRPLGLFVDVHLADDGDVGKLLDFSAGVNAVSELVGAPVLAGSTLRVGGDMVAGDRMVSCAGAVGMTLEANVASRSRVKQGDYILMTRGAGGGTICTAAIFSGNHEVVKETLNVDFYRACTAVFNVLDCVSAMADVTNGGIRGDAHEISKSANVGMKLECEKIISLVNPRVLALLETQKIDPLGVSLDSLLVFTKHPEKAMREIRRAGVQVEIIGRVEGRECVLVKNKKEEPFTPLFRESAYTKIKKLVGESTPKNFNELLERVKQATQQAIEKKNKIVEFVRKKKGE